MSPVKDHQARTVPIPAIVFDEPAESGQGKKPGDLIFPSARSTPLRNRNFRRDVFDDAVDDLGLDITPHNLRDTAASLAIQAGASVVAVARLLGHESAATTLNHYAGLFPATLQMSPLGSTSRPARRSPENARRLRRAVARDEVGRPEPSEATKAPTRHRPERSDGD